MSILRLSLWFLTVLTLPVFAQKKGNLSLRLLADTVPEGQGKVFLQAGESKSAEFALSTSKLSEPVPVGGRSVILKSADKGETLASIAIPAEGKTFAVLLSPEKPTGYLSFVIRLDDDAFKPGELFIINRAAKTLVLKLGGNEVVLEVGKSVKTHPTEAAAGAYMVTIHERGESGDKLISSTRWPMDTRLRSYIFFSTNERGRTNFRSVDEYLPDVGKRKR